MEERIENTKMAKFDPCNERVSLNDSLNFRKIYIRNFCMGNVAGEQGFAFQQHFPYKFLYSFKTSDCHKISSFNGGGLKFDHFDIPEILFFYFWHL